MSLAQCELAQLISRQVVLHLMWQMHLLLGAYTHPQQCVTLHCSINMCHTRVPCVPCAAAQLVLANWPGSKACNDKTWINDCTSKMTVQLNGSNVVMTPAVSAAFNEKCDPAQGIVIGPKGTQAAMSFPQYPIGLTSTGPDGTLQIDFSQTAADDPNNMDWGQCIITYKIIQGSFLNPIGGMYGNAMAGRGANAMGPQQLGAGAKSAAAGRAAGSVSLLAVAGAAVLVLVQLL